MTAPNAALAYRVLDHIDAHPEQHDQSQWIATTADCGTIACFAGWTCLLSGDSPAWSPYENVEDEADTGTVTVVEHGMPHDMTVSTRSTELLGIGLHDAGRLFYANDREDLGRRVAEIFGPRPVDGPVQVVDHGPVKPPYGTPERADWDSDHRWDHLDHSHDVAPNAGSAS